MSSTNGWLAEELPEHIVFEVTAACNCDCVYCYNVWKAPGTSYPKGELALPEIVRMFDRLLVELPVKSVALSGGEPFLRKDLPEIVSYLWARGLQVVIITNGTLLSAENIDRTSGATNYELPLLSHRREVHDRLARYQSFRDVLNGMRNLDRAGALFVVAFIATRVNYSDLERVVQLAVAMGARGILYNRMNAGAFNLQYLEEYFPTTDMVAENLETLEQLAAEFGIPISCSIPIQPCLIDITRYPHLQFGFCPLGGKESYYTIDPLGNLRVCNHSSTILGNLREGYFDELIQCPYVEDFKTVMPDVCLSCAPEVRSRCHGGCKMAAQECYGSFRLSEPFLRRHRDRQSLPRDSRTMRVAP